MNKLLSRDDLSDIRAKAQERIRNIRCRILICAGTGCLAGGSLKIYEKLCELCGKDPDAEIVFGPEVAHTADKTDIQKSGCHGFCEMGPLVRIEPYNYLYIKIYVYHLSPITAGLYSLSLNLSLKIPPQCLHL